MPVKIAEINDKTRWEEFVLAQHPNTFLQSWNWGEFHRLMGGKIFRLGIFKGRHLLGVALVVKEVARRGTFLACPGGPLLDWKNPRLFGSLIRFLSSLGKEENVSFIRIRPTIFKAPQNLELFAQYGFRDAPTHMHAETTWELDLSCVEEELLSGMRKSTRYDIHRARREGVNVYQSKELKEVENLYKLQIAVVKRQKFTPFSERYLKSEFSAFVADDQVELFLAKLKEKVLSVAMIVFYGDTAFYHHGASASSPPKISSSHLLLWEAIKEAKRRGLRVFNFWGIASTENPNHPWAGLTFFKKGYGGQRVDYLHAQDLPLRPWRYFFTSVYETLERRHRGL